MEKKYIWTDEDEVIDRTNSVKKIWDKIMVDFPYIKKFETIGVKEVKHKKKLGPYHMVEHKLKYSVKVEFDNQPLKDAGWDGKSKIEEDLVLKAYGKNYFPMMRDEMLTLLKYIGLGEFDNFNFDGDISCSVQN